MYRHKNKLDCDTPRGGYVVGVFGVKITHSEKC